MLITTLYKIRSFHYGLDDIVLVTGMGEMNCATGGTKEHPCPRSRILVDIALNTQKMYEQGEASQLMNETRFWDSCIIYSTSLKFPVITSTFLLYKNSRSSYEIKHRSTTSTPTSSCSLSLVAVTIRRESNMDDGIMTIRSNKREVKVQFLLFFIGTSLVVQEWFNHRRISRM
jgi:hypothetical protein